MDKKKLLKGISLGIIQAILCVSVFYFIGMSIIQVSYLFEQSTDNFLAKFIYLIGAITFLVWAGYYSIKSYFINPIINLIKIIKGIIVSGLKALIYKK